MAEPEQWPEDDLAKLSDFIAGRPPWAYKGKGMWTHPGLGDEEDAKHAGCLELERRGKVVRVREYPGCVVWSPVEG